MALADVFFTRLRWTLLIVILLGIIFFSGISSSHAGSPANWFNNSNAYQRGYSVPFGRNRNNVYLCIKSREPDEIFKPGELDPCRQAFEDSEGRCFSMLNTRFPTDRKLLELFYKGFVDFCEFYNSYDFEGVSLPSGKIFQNEDEEFNDEYKKWQYARKEFIKKLRGE